MLNFAEGGAIPRRAGKSALVLARRPSALTGGIAVNRDQERSVPRANSLPGTTSRRAGEIPPWPRDPRRPGQAALARAVDVAPAGRLLRSQRWAGRIEGGLHHWLYRPGCPGRQLVVRADVARSQRGPAHQGRRAPSPI